MLDDYAMITHRFEDEITVIPVADVHLGAIEHDEKAWESFCKSVKDEPDVYLILCGDLVQNGVRNAIGNPFDQTMSPSLQKAAMIEYLTPLKDKILCATSGNHEARTRKESDQDITYDIMCKIGLETLYRENVVFMKISIGTRQATKAKCPNVSYLFSVVHGAAGGRLTGNPVNRAEEFARTVDGLDCLIVGHSHKGTVTRPKKIVLDDKNNRVREVSSLVVGAESWMVYGGYAARKMLLPAEHGFPQRLHLSRSRDYKRIEVTW